MSEAQLRPVTPKRPTPGPITPKPVKPKPVKPIKAEHHCLETGCVRCGTAITETTGYFRQLCSACDLALQEMHWNVEQSFFRRVIYLPEVPHDDGPSLDWLTKNGYAEHIRKPPRPYLRSNYPPKTALG